MAVYADVGLNGSLVKDDISAITQKIELMIDTKPGGFAFDRKFGCDIKKYLFDVYEPWVIDNIKFDLKICLNKFVPEVELLDETDLLYSEDTRTYILKIVFKVDGLNNIYTLNYKI